MTIFPYLLGVILERTVNTPYSSWSFDYLFLNCKRSIRKIHSQSPSWTVTKGRKDEFFLFSITTSLLSLSLSLVKGYIHIRCSCTKLLPLYSLPWTLQSSKEKKEVRRLRQDSFSWTRLNRVSRKDSLFFFSDIPYFFFLLNQISLFYSGFTIYSKTRESCLASFSPWILLEE